jgi:hypothetical protein
MAAQGGKGFPHRLDSSRPASHNRRRLFSDLHRTGVAIPCQPVGSEPKCGQADVVTTQETYVFWGVSRGIQRPFTCTCLWDAMKNRALRYYMHDGPMAFRFELAGTLDYEGALRLDQDWRTASSAIGDRKLIVDMTFVTNLADEGKTLLKRWHQEGARLIANSTTSRVLAESVLGSPLPASTGDATVSNRTWLPFHASILVSTMILFVLDVMASALR